MDNNFEKTEQFNKKINKTFNTWNRKPVKLEGLIYFVRWTMIFKIQSNLTDETCQAQGSYIFYERDTKFEICIKENINSLRLPG